MENSLTFLSRLTILCVILHTLRCATASKEISPKMSTTEIRKGTSLSLTSSGTRSTTDPMFKMSGMKPLSDFPKSARPEQPRAECSFCLPVFTGGPRIFENMAQWTNLVCGKSVCDHRFYKNQCGNRICEKCLCDTQCSRYNDCCPDLLAELPVRLNTLKLACVLAAMKPWGKTKLMRVKLVSGCPSEDPDVDIETVERCHQPEPVSITENRPVYSEKTRLHYRNIYCARCNGVEELINWGIVPSCYEYIELSTITSNDEMVQLLYDSPSCNIEFQVPASSEIRECRFTQTTTKTCNVTGQWQAYNADIEKACHLLSQTVQINVEMYENIFCASCNGVSLYGNNQCSGGNRGSSNGLVLPFSIFLNVQDDKHREVSINESSCPDKEVYDSNMKYCRSFFCPPRQYPEGDECVSLYKSAKMVGYIISFKLIPRNMSHILVRRKVDFVFGIKQFIGESVGILNPALSKTSCNLTFSNTKNSSGIAIHEIEVTYSILVGVQIPREEAERQLLDLMNRKWWWYDPRFSLPVYFDFVWQRINIQLWKIDSLVNEGPSEETIFGKLRSKNYAFEHRSRGYEIPSTFNINASAYTQVSGLMMCKIIELNTTEFFVNDSRSITVKYTGKTLNEGEFLWNGEKVQICTNFTGQRMVSESSSSRTFDQTEVILTLVCTSLSLCGLVITLIIYLILPSLRTLPARNNIFLFINLFLAQLFFLTGSAAKVSTPVCRTLAIIIHYFWLSTFCWKIVCGFHMYRLFTNPLKALGYSKTLVKYVLFSQTTPCLIISLVVFVNFGLSNTLSIGYSDNPHVCFLSNKLNIGLGFVLPICFAVLLNVFLFSRSVIALRSQPEVKRHSSKKDFKRAVLYFKMALLLGFSWILGFLAMIVNEQIMWYVFTVVNASIGVFVLIMFGLRNVPFVYGRESSTSGDPGNSNNIKTYETSFNEKN